ncbi:hypothetical protein L208DRAFT_1396858 [Tricholoma matsutake]|nr:hypothetical protein L208DRAFT_1396858 [Tricholoma matsutake 945]
MWELETSAQLRRSLLRDADDQQLISSQHVVSPALSQRVQRSGSVILASSGWEAMQNVSHFFQAEYTQYFTLPAHLRTYVTYKLQ